MPFLVKATKAATDRLPKIVSPRAHAAIDYATAGAFLLSSLLLWRRHRPAAVSAMICGGSELLVAALTDYPGGIVREISFPAHGRIDVGLAMFAATVPEFMNFADDPAARLFDMQALVMAAATGLTDFTGTGETKQLARIEEEAA
jgi:hypothetical protein